MAPMRENPKRVFLRRLTLLRRLQRGPASRNDLVACVLAEDSDAYGGARGGALDKRFESDKLELRRLFGLVLRYRRADGTYEIGACGWPLLDLPDEDLATLAFLQETFGPRAPHSAEVQRLLGRLHSSLPDARREDWERQRMALQVQWGQRDHDMVPPDVERALSRALVQRRLVVFDYLSPAHADGLPRRHTVEPWERYFDSSRGHYYLRGFCRRIDGPPGAGQPGHFIRYRLGRIRNLELLPEKLPPTPPPAPRIDLVYRLSPGIARRGDVTQQPGITIRATEPQPGGSLIVRAETDDVWWAVQALLHYGPSCQVLGGTDAMTLMRHTVKEMARIYGFIAEDE